MCWTGGNISFTYIKWHDRNGASFFFNLWFTFTCFISIFHWNSGRGHKDRIHPMKIYPNSHRCPKLKDPPPTHSSSRWQNCYFSPSKRGFKDQHLAGWDAVACMSIRLHTSKTQRHSQAAMRAKGPRIEPHCHSAIITATRGWTDHFFLL